MPPTDPRDLTDDALLADVKRTPTFGVPGVASLPWAWTGGPHARNGFREADWLACSPHEWKWGKNEAIAMAKALQWAEQSLHELARRLEAARLRTNAVKGDDMTTTLADDTRDLLVRLPNASDKGPGRFSAWELLRSHAARLADEADRLYADMMTARQERAELRRHAKMLVDTIEAWGMGPLDAAVKYGPDWVPPSDQDVRDALDAMHASLRDTDQGGG